MTVAVYGTLRKDGSNNPLLATATYRGSFRSEPIYVMKDVASGGFPGIKQGGNTSILFEVYRVNKSDLAALDGLEGYKGKGDKNNHYNRKIINTPYGKAITYEYNRNFKVNNTLISSGDWIEYKKDLILKNYVC